MYGFTLVELLVVISIISLLMSIMMPSLRKAREQATRVDCMNNMRQFTFAWMMYAHDNDSKLCSSETRWIDEEYSLPCPYAYGMPHWVIGGPTGPLYPFNHIGDSEIAITEGVLWPYVKNLELYRCKSDRSGKLRSYSISNTMGGLPIEPDMNRQWQFYDIANISRSAERLVFVCAESSGRWLSGGFFPMRYDEKETIRWGNPKARPPGWREGLKITARHSNGSNISFADGHCKWWRYEDPRTVKLANGELFITDPVNNGNVDLKYLAELLKGRD